MLYSSIENKKIKDIKKLYEKKYRDLNNKFIVEGEHLVDEAYKNGLLEELILEENVNKKLNVETNYVKHNVLKYISSLETPSNIIGICKKIEEKEIGNRILVLDNIQDPGNLGTIIRSAVAFNIDTIILSNDTVDLYNPKVLRATQGMIFSINILIKELKPFLINLKENGYKIMSTRVTYGKSIKNVEKIKKFVIIVGNEGKGVKSDILSLSDEFIYIDMNKKCESLNVGVATSIILYELSR
ncbi:MAG: RNA methyltransferase [Clostridium sp.]|nr:RNA methyltransferase [Clostridium sp.]MCM1444692.1 RNA methyltransferase [Candidatus Amulumruptor caecigallinarius]